MEKLTQVLCTWIQHMKFGCQIDSSLALLSKKVVWITPLSTRNSGLFDPEAKQITANMNISLWNIANGHVNLTRTLALRQTPYQMWNLQMSACDVARILSKMALNQNWPLVAHSILRHLRPLSLVYNKISIEVLIKKSIFPTYTKAHLHAWL